MDKKKNKYKGVIPPPIVPPYIVGALKRGAKLGGMARLKKEPMGQLMRESLPVRNLDGTPRYGAGGTNNPKQTAKKKTVARKKPVAKKKAKTEAQKRYEEQIKARKKRQKKDPLGRD